MSAEQVQDEVKSALKVPLHVGRRGGWPEHAPFDIIVVTAAANEIPKPLIDQLAENGRLVIPVGETGAIQELILLVKKNGKIEKKRLTSVRFVPFRRSKN